MSDSGSEVCVHYLEKDLLFRYQEFMRLKIFVDSTDEQLKHKYKQAIDNHHLKLENNIQHIDAGFDLFAPRDQTMINVGPNIIDYQVICSATIVKQLHDCRREQNSGFYMYPRSSISNTNLRLANNVGIIDAGYRGHLMAKFDVIYDETTVVNAFNKHLQICAPGLIPIIVEMVDSKEQLGEKTARGDGGFGSTGK